MTKWVGGGGQVVSMLTFYSDDLSSNPVEADSFICKSWLKRKNINKKRAGFAPSFSLNILSKHVPRRPVGQPHRLHQDRVRSQAGRGSHCQDPKDLCSLPWQNLRTIIQRTRNQFGKTFLGESFKMPYFKLIVSL